MTDLHKKIEILSERTKNSSYLEDKLLSLEEINIIADTDPDLVAVCINDHILTNFSEDTHFMEINILKKGFSCELGKELSEIFFKNNKNLTQIYETLTVHLQNENLEYSELIIDLLLILFVHSLNLPSSITVTDHSLLLNSILVYNLKKTNLNTNFDKLIHKNAQIKKENIFFEINSVFLKKSNEFTNLINLLILLLENGYFNFVSLFLIDNPSLSISLVLSNAFEIILHSLEVNIENESLGTLVFLLKDNFMNQRLFLEHKVSKNILILLSDLFLENNFNLLPNYLSNNNCKGIYQSLLVNDSNMNLVIDNLINQSQKKDDYFYLLIGLIFKKKNEESLIKKYQNDLFVLSLYFYYTEKKIDHPKNILFNEKEILSLIIFKIKGIEIVKKESIIYLYRDFNTDFITKSFSLFYLLLIDNFTERNEFIIHFYLSQCRKFISSTNYLSEELIINLINDLHSLINRLEFNQSHLLTKIKKNKSISQEKIIIEEKNKEEKVITEDNKNDLINKLDMISVKEVEVKNIKNDESINNTFLDEFKSNLGDKTKKYKEMINKFIKKEENDIHDL